MVTVTNKPNSGDAIVELNSNSFGDSYVATPQFWAFLDELSGQVQDIDFVPPSNEAVINQASDFYDVPPATDEITLDSGIYRIGAEVDIGSHYFTIPAGGVVAFIAGHSSASKITSSTSGALIRGVDCSFYAIDVTFSAPAGRIYDFSKSAGDCVLFERNAVHSNTLLPSLLDNLIISSHLSCQYLSQAAGTFSLSGSSFGQFASQSCNFDAGIVGSAIDLNDAVLESFDLLSPRFVSTASNNLVSSDVSASANIASGKKGRVLDAAVSGADVTMPGIQSNDVRWSIFGVQGFDDSNSGLFAYTTSAETITISSSGVFRPLAPTSGSWAQTKEDLWSIASNGEATYLGEKSTLALISCEGSIASSSASAEEVQMRINRNTGSGFPATPPVYTTGQTQSIDPAQVKSSDLLQVQPGDIIRAEVANMSTATNVEVSANARLIITCQPPR